MGMIVWASLRRRPGRHLACLVATTLGASLVMTFGSLADALAVGHLDPASEQTLMIMTGVVGGWALVIVTFAVASTLSLSVRQRADELAALRTLGATPAALRRLILTEALALAVLGVALGVLPAWWASTRLMELLHRTGQVAANIEGRFGLYAVSIGTCVVIASASLGALIASHRTLALAAGAAAREAQAGTRTLGRLRLTGGVLLILGGIILAAVTVTLMKDTGMDAMTTAGQAAIVMAVGLALLSPILVRALLVRIRRGDSVAADIVGSRAVQQSSAVLPVVLFVGITVGTLSMYATEETAPPVPGASLTTAEANSVQTLNLVVVSMIALFLAIMTVNTLASATVDRRRELGRLRIAGATRGQVLSVVGAEGALVLLLGVLLGTVAAAFTALPYAYARTGSVVPDGSIVLYVGPVLAAGVLVIGTMLGATWPSLRTTPLAAATDNLSAARRAN